MSLRTIMMCVMVLALRLLPISNTSDPLMAIGAIATVINICNPKAQTEYSWNNGDPIFILHNALQSSPGGLRGITFGHVIVTAREPDNGWIDGAEYVDIIDHELAHTKQHAVLKQFYGPLYLVSMCVSLVGTGTYDEWNPLEWGPYHSIPRPWL